MSEWYSCRWDCPAIYKNSVELLNDDQEIVSDISLTEALEKDKQNVWLQVHTFIFCEFLICNFKRIKKFFCILIFQHQYTFTNYKTGVRKINFRHGGIDQNWWAGHFGSKMARACIRIESFTEIKEED